MALGDPARSDSRNAVAINESRSLGCYKTKDIGKEHMQCLVFISVSRSQLLAINRL